MPQDLVHKIHRPDARATFAVRHFNELASVCTVALRRVGHELAAGAAGIRGEKGINVAMSEESLETTEKNPDVFRIRGESRHLIVMIHGYVGTPSSFDEAMEAIEEVKALNDADVFMPALPFSMFSRARPAGIVAGILDKIDRCWAQRAEQGTPYRRVYLVGHSMGGLLVRKVYICASGTHQKARIEPRYDEELHKLGAASTKEARPWASKVERVVLIAALNRGWSISHHLGLWNAFLWSLGSFLGRLLTLFSGEQPLVFSMRRGSPFVTQLRIQWIRMRQRTWESGGSVPGGAVTVQLLGSIDDLVSPTDSIDVVSGSDFYYLDVPFSSHKTIVLMAGDTCEAKKRRKCFVSALTASKKRLKKRTTLPVDEAIVVRRDVTDVVFVMHGIRDHGYWTQKIARRVILQGAKEDRTVVAETSTYGYFPMLPFIWPRTRRKKVEWLMDEYAEAVARYPCAKFAYMGHSNGTYLLTRSLELYPVVKFTNVVLAGSVVVRDFAWDEYVRQDRIDRVLNYTATSDLVVAWFPKLFQSPRTQDLGSAGHDGFDQAGSAAVLELGPIRGGHSAARQESEWDAISEFLLNGTDVETVNAAKHRHRLVEVLGYFPIVVWLAVGGIVLLGGWGILQLVGEGWELVALVLYVALLWKVLTRV